MACNLHPKWVIVVDPDIDIRKSTGVATRPFGVEFTEVSEVPDWQKFDLPEVKKG